MTDGTGAGVGWVPAACTLPLVEQPVRRAEFDDLFAASLSGVERLGPYQLRVTVAGGSEVAVAVRALAAREARCCSFFDFGVVESGDGLVHLDIGVPPGHVDVLDALQVRAGVVRSTR